MLLIDRVGHFQFSIKQMCVASGLSFLFLMSSRSFDRSWLRARKAGVFCRRIVLIGTDHESARLYELLTTHSELVFVVTGIIGSRHEAIKRELGDLWLGDLDRAEALISFVGTSGAVVSASGMPPARLNDLIRNVHAAGIHLHIATGVAGIDSRQLLSMPLAYESLIYVEGSTLSKLQLLTKRILDVAGATTAPIVLSPLFGVVDAAIKLDCRGPVFFRQRRVGLGGDEFEVLKFRSMAVDADARLE